QGPAPLHRIVSEGAPIDCQQPASFALAQTERQKGCHRVAVYGVGKNWIVLHTHDHAEGCLMGHGGGKSWLSRSKLARQASAGFFLHSYTGARRLGARAATCSRMVQVSGSGSGTCESSTPWEPSTSTGGPPATGPST